MRASMKTTAVRLLASLLTVAPLFGAASYDSPQALADELRRIETAIDEGHGKEVHDALPPAWVVKNGQHQYSISTGDLKEQLDKNDEDSATDWLDQVTEQLDESAAPASGRGSPRAALNRILSQREFAGVRPPNLWERILERIRNWFGDLLGSLFGFLGPSSGKFVWAAGGVAVVFLALWLYRTLRKNVHVPAAHGSVEPAIVRTWEQWAQAAREALARDDFRSAAHAAYWAGVMRLQNERLLPGNTTLTAREYLRLIPHDRKAFGPFSTLAGGLERFWYANRTATAGDVHKLMENMEELGCRPD